MTEQLKREILFLCRKKYYYEKGLKMYTRMLTNPKYLTFKKSNKAFVDYFTKKINEYKNKISKFRSKYNV